MFIHTLISMYLEIYSVAVEFQKYIQDPHMGVFDLYKNFTFVYKQQKKYCIYKIYQNVFQWASNYVLTLETDDDYPAFLPLLSYLHG